MKYLLKRSNKHITGLSIGFFGLQMGFALQAGNVTRILQNYGADLQQISLLWLIAPLTGAIIQPIIGYISDIWITNGKTRIPLLIIGAIISTISLLALPNASIFIVFLTPLLFGSIAILVIDIAFNISMHPLRATITDYLDPEQQPKGFAIQTFLISAGAVIGSVLPYFLNKFLHLNSVSNSQNIPDNVKWSFYLGSLILLSTMLLNAKVIKKLSPIKERIIVENHKSTINSISKSMWSIGSIQFFSWSCFFLIWVFMTPAVAQKFYNEYNYNAQSQNYADAANFTGILFGIYHITASLFSMSLPFLFSKMKIINTHLLALLLGGVGLLALFFATNIEELYLPMVLLGVAWASILSAPYALLSKNIPKRNIGFNIGILNLFITAPQIINGLWSGYVIENYYEGNAIYAILIASISLFIAGILCFFMRRKL